MEVHVCHHSLDEAEAVTVSMPGLYGEALSQNHHHHNTVMTRKQSKIVTKKDIKKKEFM